MSERISAAEHEAIAASEQDALQWLFSEEAMVLTCGQAREEMRKRWGSEVDANLAARFGPSPAPDWPGGFQAGERVVIRGTIFDTQVGTVVDRSAGKFSNPPPGVVGVYLPEYPATVYWWFTPPNLERLSEKTSVGVSPAVV